MSTTANNRNRNNKSNNNTSTSGTGKNTAMLGLPTKSSISNKENSKIQNNTTNKNETPEQNTTKSLLELEKETEEMQIKNIIR